jgi:hypothetical protein
VAAEEIGAEILETLQEIRAALKVIASDRRDAVIKELEERSPKRKKMFRLFNRKWNLTDIAKKVTTSK